MGGKSGGNEAKLAREEEQARQERIRQGTKRVNTIFDGGTYGSGALEEGAVFDPSKTYYLADGSVWDPNSSGGVDGVFRGNPQDMLGSLAGAVTGGVGNSFAEMVKSGKLFSGVSNSTGFNDEFYDQRKKSFMDYATPQLEKQYGDANKELSFALARSGLLNSSARATKAGDLQSLYDINKQDVADKALGYETEARTSVEDARQNLISMLNATGDDQGAASSAIARASTLSKPTPYSPLGQLFAEFTNTLGIQAAQERSFAAGGPRPAYNTGIFGGKSRVVTKG